MMHSSILLGYLGILVQLIIILFVSWLFYSKSQSFLVKLVFENVCDDVLRLDSTFHLLAMM